jgi:hypothetical protein
MFLQLARKAPAQVWSAQALLLPGLPLEGLGSCISSKGSFSARLVKTTPPRDPNLGKGGPRT